MLLSDQNFWNSTQLVRPERIQFLGEQDGPPERELKSSLIAAFRCNRDVIENKALFDEGIAERSRHQVNRLPAEVSPPVIHRLRIDELFHAAEEIRSQHQILRRRWSMDGRQITGEVE